MKTNRRIYVQGKQCCKENEKGKIVKVTHFTPLTFDIFWMKRQPPWLLLWLLYPSSQENHTKKSGGTRDCISFGVSSDFKVKASLLSYLILLSSIWFSRSPRQAFTTTTYDMHSKIYLQKGRIERSYVRPCLTLSTLGFPSMCVNSPRISPTEIVFPSEQYNTPFSFPWVMIVKKRILNLSLS